MTDIGEVVIVGAGFGGLTAARALAKDDVHVEVIDRRNHHVFQPLLYQVATAGLEASDIAYAVRGITKKLPSVDFYFDEVTGADLDAKVLHTTSRGDVPYDKLILAAGARTATFGIPGVEEHAFGLKSLVDALDFRRHLLEQFERCAGDPSQIYQGALNVAVVGGGPTGVEMAGAVAELYEKVMEQDFPELNLSPVNITLIEMADYVLAPFHPKLQENAKTELRKRGVVLRLGTSVAEITPEGVIVDDGEIIRARTCVWAAGVEAEPLGQAMGLEIDRAGRIIVEEDLSVPGHPEVFVIGDLAAVTGENGKPLPQLAPVALQQGGYVAEVLRDRVAGRGTRPFRYVDKGSMSTIGRRSAVAELPGGIRFTGSMAWLAWFFLHIYFLIGFRNRISVMMNWIWNFWTWDRAARVVPSAHPAEVHKKEPSEPGGPGSGP